MGVTVDYLIVGQGLAGSLLAREMLRLGQKIRIVDRGDPASSSRIAAGVINPITGQRFALAWNVERLLPAAKRTYRELEAELGARFFHEIPILRLFRGDDEAEHCLQRSLRPEFRPYIGDRLDPGASPPWIRCEHGGLQIDGGGWVDTGWLLDGMRNEFRNDGIFVEAAVRYEDVRLTEGCVEWRDVRSSRIVWCNGADALPNPWFSRVRFQPSKGEVLTVRIPGVAAPGVLSRGISVVPVRDDIFTVGSTYDPEFEDALPTPAGREQLMKGLREMIRSDFDVIGHAAAVRPGTLQRVPVAGTHPDTPEVALFNGLGSKGVLEAPYYSTQVAEHLVRGRPLDRAVNLSSHMAAQGQCCVRPVPAHGGPR